MSTPDSIAIIEQLDPAALAERLRNLDDERKAVVILLRAAHAREKRQPRDQKARISLAKKLGGANA
jgi:hypothetical protein